MPADEWEDTDARLADRRAAAQAVLAYALKTGDAVGKSDATAGFLPEYDVDGRRVRQRPPRLRRRAPGSRRWRVTSHGLASVQKPEEQATLSILIKQPSGCNIVGWRGTSLAGDWVVFPGEKSCEGPRYLTRTPRGATLSMRINGPVAHKLIVVSWQLAQVPQTGVLVPPCCNSTQRRHTPEGATLSTGFPHNRRSERM